MATAGSGTEIGSALTYREGDGQIDLIANICNISLSEEARQADLGTICM